MFFSTYFAGALPKGPTSLWSVNMYEWNRMCRAMKGNGVLKCLNCPVHIRPGSSRQLSDAHGVIGTICQKCRNTNRSKTEAGTLIKDAAKEAAMAARLRSQLTAPPPVAQSANHQPASSHAAEKLTCVVPTCCKPIVGGQSKVLKNTDGAILGHLCLSCRNSLRSKSKGGYEENLQRFVDAAEAANACSTPIANGGTSGNAVATAKGQDMPASDLPETFDEGELGADGGGTGGDAPQGGDVLDKEHNANPVPKPQPPRYPNLPGPPTPNPLSSPAIPSPPGSVPIGNAFGTSRHGSCLSSAPASAFKSAKSQGDEGPSPGLLGIDCGQRDPFNSPQAGAGSGGSITGEGVGGERDGDDGTEQASHVAAIPTSPPVYSSESGRRPAWDPPSPPLSTFRRWYNMIPGLRDGATLAAGTLNISRQMLFAAFGHQEAPELTFFAGEVVVFFEKAAMYLHLVTVREVHWEHGTNPRYSIVLADGTVKSNITYAELDKTFLKVLEADPDAGFLRAEDKAAFYSKQRAACAILAQHSQNMSAALEPDEDKLVDGYLDSPLHLLEAVVSELNSVPVTRNKIRCLLPTEWLNDEVINFYIELLKVLTHTCTCTCACSQHTYLRIHYHRHIFLHGKISYVPSTIRYLTFLLHVAAS